MSRASNDDELLAELKSALSHPPHAATEVAQACLSWRTIDAEFAQLTYDSLLEPMPATRAEGTAELRSMTFDAAGLSIEIEVAVRVIHGQLVPPQAGRAELRFQDESVAEAIINDSGYFTAAFFPPARFRLYCAPDGSAAVLTDWIYL